MATVLGAAHLPFDISPAAIAAASGDFGRIASGRVHALVKPESPDQLVTLVRLARTHKWRLAVRGAGLSQSGQSIARDGLTLDMSALRAVRAPDALAQSVVCEPGARWREVLARVAPLGLIPSVMPLNLDLTVGGTLSAGGLGSNSHRRGLCVSNVAGIEVVLGSGEVVRASPTQQRDVFDSVLGGLGRVGILRSVELKLSRLAPHVRTYYLLYPNAAALLADQRRLHDHPRVDHLEGFVSSSVHGLQLAPSGRRQPLRRWHYTLQVSVEYAGDAADAPANAELLAGLHYQQLLHIEEDSALAFASRFDVRFEAMRAMGHWELAHPWFEAFVPADALPDVLKRVEQLPAFLGDGHRLISVADLDRPAAVAVPDGEALVLALLPTGIPDALRAPALQVLRDLDDYIRSRGGKRYLSGYLFGLGQELPWSAHYGAAHARLAALQTTYDPDRIFGACLAGL